jgi:hypothetical protein
VRAGGNVERSNLQGDFAHDGGGGIGAGTPHLSEGHDGAEYFAAVHGWGAVIDGDGLLVELGEGHLHGRGQGVVRLVHGHRAGWARCLRVSAWGGAEGCGEG